MDKPMTDFDKRIVHRSVRKGLLGSEEVRHYHDELPDASDKAEVVRPEDLEEEKRVRPAADAAPPEPIATEASEADAPAEGQAPGAEEAAPSGAAGEDTSGESGADPSGESGADPSGESGGDPSDEDGADPSGQEV
jgi:hypothetical protein